MSKKRNKTSGKIRKSRVANVARNARQALQQGNYDKAIVSLTSSQAKQVIPLERRQSALAEAYFRRACRYRNTSPKDALRDLQQTVDLMPEDALYTYHLGLLHHHMGNPQAAIEWYRKALSLDAELNRAALPLLLAMQATDASQQDLQAENAWQMLDGEQQALLTGNISEIDTGLPGALSAMHNGDTHTARQRFEKVLKNTRVPKNQQAIVHDHLGRLAAAEDDLESALQYWTKAYDLGLRSSTFKDNLALAYVLRLESLVTDENYEEATLLAKEPVKRNLDHPRLSDLRGHILLQRGYQSALKEDWLTALDHWKAANPDGATARALAANIALAHEKLEQYGQAADAWRDFVKRRSRTPGHKDYLTPEQVSRLWARISNLYARSEHAYQAVDTLKTALKHDPDNIELNLQLARRLAEISSTDAAHNQIERVLDMQPDHIEALVFNAELWEAAPKSGGFMFSPVTGIPQWRAVYETGDEGYAGMARQRLHDLYCEKVNFMMRFNPDAARQTAKEALAEFPDFHSLRALYTETLYINRAAPTQIEAQIEKIDLTDENVLHQLIDITHIHNTDADAILQKAESLQPLTSDFYVGVAHCAVNRDQFDVAQTYYQRATERANDDDEKHSVIVSSAQAYYAHGDSDRAMEILEGVLEEDRQFGPAHLGMAAMAMEEEDNKKAKRHLRKARRWAKKNKDQTLLDQIEMLQFQLENPLGALGGMLGGINTDALPPELREMLENMGPQGLANMLDSLDFDDQDVF